MKDLRSQVLDEPTLESLANLCGVGVDAGKPSAQRKQQTLANVVDWLRNNDLESSELDDDLAVAALTNAAGIPYLELLPRSRRRR
jgi:hypothetical protein